MSTSGRKDITLYFYRYTDQSRLASGQSKPQYKLLLRGIISMLSRRDTMRINKASACALLTVLAFIATSAFSMAANKQPPKKDWKNNPNATQRDLDAGSDSDFQKADKELNRLYNQILAKNAADKMFIQKFIKSEKAWIAFRDAEVDARFPHDPDDYGSSLPMCQSLELAQLTSARVKQIKPWLNGVQEGDVCCGSYPVK
jgi:uncharacterized protein YecT (DUF1311 family)